MPEARSTVKITTGPQTAEDCKQFSLWDAAGPAGPPYLPQFVDFTRLLVGRGRRARRHKFIMRMAAFLRIAAAERDAYI